MAAKKSSPIDQELIKALAHPLRIRILEELQERTASPSVLAEETGESLGLISYHANMLVKFGCLELIETRPRRGALEHFFRATPRSFIGHQDWRAVPRSVRGAVTAAAAGSFVEKASAAAAAGTIDARDDTTFNWMPMRVDETGWREVAEILDTALKHLMAVHDRSAKRLGGAAGIPVVVGLAGFEASGGTSPR